MSWVDWPMFAGVFVLVLVAFMLIIWTEEKQQERSDRRADARHVEPSSNLDRLDGIK